MTKPRPRRLMTMRQALEEPEIFGEYLGGDTWKAWRVVLIASQGEPLTDDEREIFAALTNREVEPVAPLKEVWGVVGRRGGKTNAFAVAAAYFSRLIDYSGCFMPGQRGRVPIMAATKEQAREAFNYLLGIFTEIPVFAEMVEDEPTADTIRLKNRVDIQISTASYKTARGFTPVAAICDEIAFWFIESNAANPDYEVLRALRPGLATFGGPLFVLSSPYARKGELWKTYDKHFGVENPRTLVLQAPTLTMHDNPHLAEEIEVAYEEDPASAAAEFGAEFRRDIEAFVSIEAVRACTPGTLTEIPPEPDKTYRAFVDVSGGSADAMTLAIGHSEGKLAVLDVAREMPAGTPPSVVVQTFSDLLKTYRVGTVRGDRYGKEWVQEQFRAASIAYEESPQNKSQIYSEFLPVLNSRRCQLLPIPKLERQLVSLERRTTRGTGRDIIDHPQKKGSHDDLANAVCGVIVILSTQPSIIDLYIRLGEQGD